MGIRTAEKILQKTPEEVRHMNFNFAGDELADGEILSDVLEVSITPPGITNESTAIEGTVAQLTLASGEVGVEYSVKVRAETDNGQVLVMVGRVVVGDP